MKNLRLLLFLPLFAACVTQGTFDKKVADLDALRAKDNASAADREKALHAQIDSLDKQIADLNQQLSDGTTKLAAVTA